MTALIEWIVSFWYLVVSKVKSAPVQKTIAEPPSNVEVVPAQATWTVSNPFPADPAGQAPAADVATAVSTTTTEPVDVTVSTTTEEAPHPVTEEVPVVTPAPDLTQTAVTVPDTTGETNEVN